MFLHASILHIAFNMLALWWFGTAVEEALGTWRYLVIYFVSGIVGSVGALLFSSPLAVTVGASGAIFGIMGALLILQYRATGIARGPALTVIVLNLAFTFAIPGISKGGHLGASSAASSRRSRSTSRGGGGRRPLGPRPRRGDRSGQHRRRLPARRRLRCEHSADVRALGRESQPPTATGGDAGLGQRRLRRGEPRERHPVGRAADVVEAEARGRTRPSAARRRARRRSPS